MHFRLEVAQKCSKAQYLAEKRLRPFVFMANADFPRRMQALISSPRGADFHLVGTEEYFEDDENPFAMCAKRSFVPLLGEVLWEVQDEDERTGYYAYTCKSAGGEVIGYVRVPDFRYSEDRVWAFERLISRFRADTDALVVDVTHNGGGSMRHMYSLLSMLTSRPLLLPQHQIVIGDDEAAVAADIIANADDELPERVAYSRLVLSERAAGRGTPERLSRPLFLDGLKHVIPAETHYAKKIVVLVSTRTMSAGEFFSAILQDNRAAIIFGEPTAGGGGCVKKVPLKLSDMLMSISWTIAWRTNGDLIDNLGVCPHINYPLTVEDLITGFNGYRLALLDALREARFEDATSAWQPTKAQLTEILARHAAGRESKDIRGARANLRRAILAGEDLAAVYLNGAALCEADLHGANLRAARLSRANLRGANLNESDLQDAVLRGAQLSGASLRGANLCRTDLRGANLSDADLRGATLRGADLLDAYLLGANLEAADVRDATGLAACQ
jgi:hypothetical protein